jgi:hypothetical protein
MIFASSSGWECIFKAKAVRVPPEGAVAENTLDFGRLLPSYVARRGRLLLARRRILIPHGLEEPSGLAR